MYMPSNSPPLQLHDDGFSELAEVAASSAHDEAAPAPRSTAHCRISLEGEPDQIWIRLRANCPCTFTRELLGELRGLQERIVAYARGGERPPKYQILSTQRPDVFSLGGDLALILSLIHI